MIKINEIIRDDYIKWYNKDYIFEKCNGIFKSITFGNFIEKTIYLSEFLIKNNLKNKRVMIYAENSINWMIADLAITAYVGESVLISKEWKYDDIDYAIDLLNINCIIFSKSKKEVINEIKNKYFNVIYLCMDDFEEIFKIGKSLNNLKQNMFNFKNKNNDECSKIIFTSGTSAMPKAVKLSLKNIYSCYNALSLRASTNENDTAYLFLPLSHAYANITNFMYSLVSGCKIYLSSSIQSIQSELLEINPTIFCSVPLIYIKMYNYSKENLYNLFGDKIKFLYCGGVSWDKNIRKYYKKIGLNIIEAYGSTETSSLISIEYPNKDDFESVGTIIEDINVKIIDKDINGNGEIVVKGDNVFLGYANNDKETKNAFTNDGYFKTGDIGYIDIYNRLYIIGRKKNVLIGSNGENISVERISMKIKELNKNITNVKIFMKNGKLNCIIYLKQMECIDWEYIINKYNSGCPNYENIDSYKVILDTVDERLKQ